MKAVISTTYDDKYLFFLPIVTWCWNKLGVDVICFAPRFDDINSKMLLVMELFCKSSDRNRIEYFSAPEHKQVTYAQCSRLYAACLDLPESEVLVTSDIDMALFQVPPFEGSGFTIFGSDLTPTNQYPMCYISAVASEWRSIFGLRGKTYQQCLDELLGDIECDGFRGNYWGKDQETAFDTIWLKGGIHQINRARPGTQFASLRYDRDDAFLLERLSHDTIDFHMNRPGFEDKNFDIILKVLQYHYPYEDFTWLIDYKNEYIKLL